MRHVGGGWVRVSSGIIDSAIFRARGDMFRLWMVLLCTAHRGTDPLRLVGGLEIQQGEMVTSLAGLFQKLQKQGNPREGEPAVVGPSRQTIARYLDIMEGDGMIERRSTPNRGTILRIVNFAEYQDLDTYRLARSDDRTDSNGQGQPDELADEDGTESEPIGASNGQQRTTLELSDSGSPEITKEDDGQQQPLLTPEDAPTTTPERLRFDYKTGKWNRLTTPEEKSRWKKAYPSVNLSSEFYQATEWLIDNYPQKRKVDFIRFLKGWFAREQRKLDARIR